MALYFTFSGRLYAQRNKVTSTMNEATYSNKLLGEKTTSSIALARMAKKLRNN